VPRSTAPAWPTAKPFVVSEPTDKTASPDYADKKKAYDE
jgi:hypothetical protein